jgi:hypothetical protein
MAKFILTKSNGNARAIHGQFPSGRFVVSGMGVPISPTAMR